MNENMNNNQIIETKEFKVLLNLLEKAEQIISIINLPDSSLEKYNTLKKMTFDILNINFVPLEKRKIESQAMINKDNNLEKLLESSVEEINNEIVAKPLDGSESFIMQPNDEVSMNMLTFTPSIFKYIEQYFIEFLEKNKNNLQSCEYLIPDLVNKLVQMKKISVKVVPTDSMWYGVTYKEDKEEVVENIKTLIKQKKYPNNLWK